VQEPKEAVIGEYWRDYKAKEKKKKEP